MKRLLLLRQQELYFTHSCIPGQQIEDKLETDSQHGKHVT